MGPIPSGRIVRTDSHTDKPNDDHVDILTQPNGKLVVEYADERNNKIRRGEIQPGDGL
jgi:hypothetical protein